MAGAESVMADAKLFLDGNLVPQVLRSIICGLMVERPDDHMAYICEKLQLIKEHGRSSVDWETFVYDLHPYRDPLRLNLIHDFSKYYMEHLEKDQEPVVLGSGKKTKAESYKPDVFALTETEEETPEGS